MTKKRDDTPHFKVPHEIFGDEELIEALIRGYFDAEQCARIWQKLELQSEPPQKKEILVSGFKMPRKRKR